MESPNENAKLVAWNNSQSTFPGAWHNDVLEGHDNGRMLFLKPTTSSISIFAHFETSISNDFQGSYLSIRMGRLACPSGPFTITAAVATSPSSKTGTTPPKVQSFVTAASTSLLPATDVAFTLELGKIDIAANIRSQITVTVHLIPNDASQGPMAGLFLDWAKLETQNLSPVIETIRETLPDFPNIVIRSKDDVSNIIPQSTRRAVHPGVHFANQAEPPRFATPPRQQSWGSRLQRQLSFPPGSSAIQEPAVPPPAYGELPAVRFLKLVKDKDRWKRVAFAILYSRIRDLFLARLVVRWVLAFGSWLLGPQTLWLTPSSLLLFWVVNYFIFGKALGKFSTWGGLWTCAVLPGSSGFWKASGFDLFMFGGLVWTGGWIDGRFFTAEEIAPCWAKECVIINFNNQFLDEGKPILVRLRTHCNMEMDKKNVPRLFRCQCV